MHEARSLTVEARSFIAEPPSLTRQGRRLIAEARRLARRARSPVVEAPRASRSEPKASAMKRKARRAGLLPSPPGSEPRRHTPRCAVGQKGTWRAVVRPGLPRAARCRGLASSPAPSVSGPRATRSRRPAPLPPPSRASPLSAERPGAARGRSYGRVAARGSARGCRGLRSGNPSSSASSSCRRGPRCLRRRQWRAARTRFASSLDRPGR